MNQITDETMEYLGILAKLTLSQEEREQARQELEKMLDYVDQLKELDTSAAEPMTHVFAETNVFREDVVTNGEQEEQNIRDTLANAPAVRNGMLMVPRTVE